MISANFLGVKIAKAGTKKYVKSLKISKSQLSLKVGQIKKIKYKVNGG